MPAARKPMPPIIIPVSDTHLDVYKRQMLHCVCCPKNGFRLWNEAENKMAENWRSFADDTKKQICYN